VTTDQEDQEMDDRRFDQWTRSFDALPSRRAMAKLLAGSLLGTLLTSFGADAAAAKCVRPGKKCDRKDPKKDKCCGGAKCRGKRCRCTMGRAACGKTCCAKGELCAGGKCVVGQANCPAGADSCAGDPVFCTDNPTCICFARIEGGTRCGQVPSPLVCVPCVTDAQCRQQGFPAGSSCVLANGPGCVCDTIGACITPCGIAPPPPPPPPA
jgi:hypothetical protein